MQVAGNSLVAAICLTQSGCDEPRKPDSPRPLNRTHSDDILSQPDDPRFMVVEHHELQHAGNGEYQLNGIPYTGKSRVFAKDSDQILEQSEFSLGKYSGTQRTWHPNGKLKSTEQFHNGYRHGIAQYFNEDGVILKTEQWQDNRLIRSQAGSGAKISDS